MGSRSKGARQRNRERGRKWRSLEKDFRHGGSLTRRWEKATKGVLEDVSLGDELSLPFEWETNPRGVRQLHARYHSKDGARVLAVLDYADEKRWVEGELLRVKIVRILGKQGAVQIFLARVSTPI